mmetsp:Transcript_28491/g.48411  ORF Transcript_28491/g.48411 Transcript_28491/m.48411 type:complete len:299 (-) Transcript_28491:507-1403(-)
MPPDHHRGKEHLRQQEGPGKRPRVIQQQHPDGNLRDRGNPQLCGQGLDVVLLVARSVREVLRDRDDDGEHHHENGNELDLRDPGERQAERRADRVEDAPVQQEPPARGDDEERGHREALEAQRGDAVDGAQEQAEGVQPRDEGPEDAGDDGAPEGPEGHDQDPGLVGGQPAGRHGQERLVHLVDVDVVDLVDPHDVPIPAQQRQEAQQRTGDERQLDQRRVGEQRLGHHREGPHDGAPDRVRPEEVPGGRHQLHGLGLGRPLLVVRRGGEHGVAFGAQDRHEGQHQSETGADVDGVQP